MERAKNRSVDLVPSKVLQMFKMTMLDTLYLNSICRFLLTKIPVAELSSTTRELTMIRQEFENRKKGLDWVDKLLSHTPETERVDDV